MKHAVKEQAAVSDQAAPDVAVKRLELVASVLAGRPLQVLPAAQNEPSWTDGAAIYLNQELSDQEQVASLCVQASLLACGSLAPEILKKLGRNTKLTARYLALEGHRVLVENKAFLPPLMHAVFDLRAPLKVSSPIDSLMLAQESQSLNLAPETFGVIRTKRLLAASNTGKANLDSQANLHKPKHQPTSLEELDDDDDPGDGYDRGAAVDKFSLGGGGGSIGKLFEKLFRVGRSSEPSGSPGGDVATHSTRALARRGGKSVLSTVAMTESSDLLKREAGKKYPEWDRINHRYRPDWCTVQETEVKLKHGAVAECADCHELRRSLSKVALGLDHFHRQFQGDEIDIDAAIDAQIEVRSGHSPSEDIYVTTARRRRDLSVLILLDISASTSEPAGNGQTLHEQQRSAAASLATTLHSFGDRIALYAYNSQGRAAVQLMPVKRFSERFGSLSRRRLSSLTPCAYSRLGAAMRHGTAVLEKEGGTARRLLLVLSDGLAYDHGYELDYGAADARRALDEARRRGVGCLCLAFGKNTDAESLRRVFGSAAYANVQKPSELGRVAGRLIYSALRSAEVKRKVS